jgi:hypothetical protein
MQRASGLDSVPSLSSMAEMRTTTLMELFPYLAGYFSTPIPLYRLDKRSQTSLYRMGLETWGDLSELTVGELWAIPNVGRLTVERVLSAASQIPLEGSPSTEDHESHVAKPRDLDLSLDAAAQWAVVSSDKPTLRSLLAGVAEGTSVPEPVAAEVNALLDLPLSRFHQTSIEPLGYIIDELWASARNPELLEARELAPTPPTLEELGKQQGVTRERIRQIVSRDARLVRAALDNPQFLAVKWASEQLAADLGSLASADSEAVAAWRTRLGDRGFEILRWTAGFVYRGDWLAHNIDPLSALESALRDEWLVRADQLPSLFDVPVQQESVLNLMIASKAWRDIGDDWLLRWDGSIVDKAERVLRLTGEPKTASELISLIGHGTEINLKNSHRPRLSRVDKNFRLAPADWGLEEYEGIVIEIEQRIERGGGKASKSAIVDEFTREFGVSESSINTYLALQVFKVVGDVVRLSDGFSFSPKPPSTISGSELTTKGWGQRHVVTEDSLKGYSFNLSPHICWANGLKPEDDLSVPVNGSHTAEASVIWRIKNLNGTVDVGRLRPWLEQKGGNTGDPLLICPTPDGVTVYLGDEEIEDALKTFAAETPSIAPDLAALMEDL